VSAAANAGAAAGTAAATAAGAAERTAAAGAGEPAVGSPEWVARHGLSAVETCRLAQRELARRDERFFSLEADLGDFGGFPFRDEFPGRYLDFGIAEASMVGAAAGLALRGKIPLVNTFATFALMRACEQVRLDLCYHRANAKIFGSFAGLQAGFSGPTHHAIEDLAVARSLPNLTVIAPADAIAAYHATLAAGAHAGPVYIRLAMDATPQVYAERCPFEIGKGVVLRAGSDLTLVAAGLTVVAEALAAAELLAGDGIGARVIDLHTLKPLDRELLARAAAETGLVVTVEEHSRFGGLGGAVAEALGEDCPVPMRILGLPDAYCEQVGPHSEHLRRYGLDAAGIAAAAGRALASKKG
jgi:transketolase